MDILIYGAGVLGSIYAARLQQAGHRVSILARGHRLIDLQQHGIILENAVTAERIATRVTIVEQLEPDDVYDLVIVLMRKNQVSAILPVLAANHHTPNVLFMVNNAAGSGEYVKALGYRRVLLGLSGAAGTRDGHIIRYYIASRDAQPTVLGELDGQITLRLAQIAAAFESAGFTVRFSANMDAWLKTHVALLSPIATALYMVGGNNYRLARTHSGLVLSVRAIREGFSVLRALNVPITPPAYKLLERIPEPILVALLRRLLNTRRAELAIARHANAARDEMQQLADEFMVLARATTVPTPALDCLYTYLDPNVPVVSDDAHRLAVAWHRVVVGLGALVGLVAALSVLKSRRPGAAIRKHQGI